MSARRGTPRGCAKGRAAPLRPQDGRGRTPVGSCTPRTGWREWGTGHQRKAAAVTGPRGPASCWVPARGGHRAAPSPTQARALPASRRRLSRSQRQPGPEAGSHEAFPAETGRARGWGGLGGGLRGPQTRMGLLAAAAREGPLCGRSRPLCVSLAPGRPVAIGSGPGGAVPGDGVECLRSH